MNAADRPQPKPRAAYRAFVPITTRWADNDVYGHINNVAYYGFFDSAVNGWLIGQGLLDIAHGDTIGLVVHTQCHYFAPLAFPQAVEAGLAVSRIGSSSVQYEVGIFAAGDAISAAHGQFVHVYVDRAARRPQALTAAFSAALQTLTIENVPLSGTGAGQ
jgi:acyl-CoA thioester hydrolase